MPVSFGPNIWLKHAKIYYSFNVKDENQPLQQCLTASVNKVKNWNVLSAKEGAGRGKKGGEEMLGNSSVLVLHLLKEFVGGILVAVLLHLGQVALLWRHRSIHLQTGGKKVSKTTVFYKNKHKAAL